MSVPAAVRRVIVGTAGHIDHGKTTLVERLTGTRTDRLPEEQERGMTIDVGYAEFRLADGTEVGLLDVPGHERLVRTMVAGATSMHVVLLVVAADDGPMLQTREHLDIVDVLGIRRAVVALTKIDVAGPSRTEEVEAQVRSLLEGTSIAGAPIVRVSSTTGEGVEAVRSALVEAIPPADEIDESTDDPRAFRMPILRAFVAPGRGTVVTGIPVSGRLVAGDAVEVLPSMWRGRVRGVQVHHRNAGEARADHRAALLVPELTAADVERGMVVAAEGAMRPVDRVVTRLRVLSHLRKPLRHGMAVRVHVGADDVPARLHVLDADRLEPGSVSAVELEGLRPFLVAPGDRFVLRTDNGSDTIGGGLVVACREGRLPRRQKGLVASLLARAERIHDPVSLARDCVADAQERGIAVQDLAVATGLKAESLTAILDALVAKKEVARAGRRVFDASALASLASRVLETLRGLHAKDAALPSVPLVALRQALATADPEAIEAAIGRLVAADEVALVAPGGIASRRHARGLSVEDRDRCERVHAPVRAGGGKPPDEASLPTLVGIESRLVRRALGLLEADGRVVRVGPHWFDAAWLREAKARLRELAPGGKTFTASEACIALATTRKFGIPLLEALDEEGFSKRTGALRVVR